ncbi:hypothetical protein GH714_038510 [Hevea brasiliensis]|uniref:Mechanosensitive ion channel protein n=1 Tax=Hevea brasiliensis TaxID=3981 RepID=A0A6A6KE79_HEVBR|nr:hypothetical protein GH714_038510 [Hevea brasiliensis]
MADGTNDVNMRITVADNETKYVILQISDAEQPQLNDTEVWACESVIYCVYGVKKSIMFFIWLGLVTLAWGLLFNFGVNRNKDSTHIVHKITRGLGGCLIGAAIWLLKSILVWSIGSVHAKKLFSRIKEAKCFRNILRVLSVRCDSGSQEVENVHAEIMEDSIDLIRGHRLRPLSYKDNGIDEKSLMRMEHTKLPIRFSTNYRLEMILEGLNIQSVHLKHLVSSIDIQHLQGEFNTDLDKPMSRSISGTGCGNGQLIDTHLDRYILQMTVDEMTIMTTKFKRDDDGELICYPNAVLATTPIKMLYKIPQKSDCLEFGIDVSTPQSAFERLQHRIKRYLQENPRRWQPEHSIQVMAIDDNKMTVALHVNHTINYRHRKKRAKRRSDLLLEMRHIFQDLGIQYNLPRQRVHLFFEGGNALTPLSVFQ